jgi:hypothetical protein
MRPTCSGRRSTSRLRSKQAGLSGVWIIEINLGSDIEIPSLQTGIIPPMRSALSLTLVLIAAMSGHGASACEVVSAHHSLRVLISSGQLQADPAPAVELGTSSSVVPSVTDLRAGGGLPTLAIACTELPSRSYESAAVASVPSRGP